jgi:hypothetical protein
MRHFEPSVPLFVIAAQKIKYTAPDALISAGNTKQVNRTILFLFCPLPVYCFLYRRYFKAYVTLLQDSLTLAAHCVGFFVN